MKWPLSIMLVRHGQSAYNVLREKKAFDPEYQEFCRLFAHERGKSELLQRRARVIRERFALNVSDYATPLSAHGVEQARITGAQLGKDESDNRQPDVIFVSPYVRTIQSLDGMISGGFDTRGAKIIVEDRIREQEHGLSLLYNDWRVFQAMHPEQRELRELLGPYWYQYPQGESVSMVRDRIRSFTDTLIRECAGKHVMLITHHLTILSIRANYERLTPEEFVHLDEHEKPVNCGVTVYRGNRYEGANGRLELLCYNKKLY